VYGPPGVKSLKGGESGAENIENRVERKRKSTSKRARKDDKESPKGMRSKGGIDRRRAGNYCSREW